MRYINKTKNPTAILIVPTNNPSESRERPRLAQHSSTRSINTLKLTKQSQKHKENNNKCCWAEIFTIYRDAWTKVYIHDQVNATTSHLKHSTCLQTGTVNYLTNEYSEYTTTNPCEMRASSCIFTSVIPITPRTRCQWLLPPFSWWPSPPDWLIDWLTAIIYLYLYIYLSVSIYIYIYIFLYLYIIYLYIYFLSLDRIKWGLPQTCIQPRMHPRWRHWGLEVHVRLSADLQADYWNDAVWHLKESLALQKTHQHYKRERGMHSTHEHIQTSNYGLSDTHTYGPLCWNSANGSDQNRQQLLTRIIF